MKFYRIGFVEGIGICGIKGYGKFISDNRRGKLTKSKPDEIANQVKSKYGIWTKKLIVFLLNQQCNQVIGYIL